MIYFRIHIFNTLNARSRFRIWWRNSLSHSQFVCRKRYL